MSGDSSRRLLLIFGRHSLEIGAFVAVLFCGTASFAAPITAGNLVLVRAAGGPNGDASVPLAGGGLAAAVFLDEYTTAGVFVQSFAMPNTLSTTVGSQRALTLSGAANTEGLLTLSGDGRYFIMAGYNQTANVAGTNATASTTVERVVGRMDFNGNIDTTTALVDAMSSQSVRSAYSPDGTNFYVTGNGGNGVTINSASVTTTGVHFAQLGVQTGGTTLSTQINTTGDVSNNRQVLVFNGDLYVSNGNTSNPNALARGVDKMGPVSGGQQLFSLPGFPTAAGPAPDDFWFFDGSTIYLADQRANGTNGGIQKWTFDGTNWNLQYTLGTTQLTTTAATPGPAGVHGLTGMINGSGQAVLFGTTFDGTGADTTKFFTVTDTGAASIVTVLGTSATNTAFRGIEIALLAPTPEPCNIILLSLGGFCAAPLFRRRK
jgi:hypothetical protein